LVIHFANMTNENVSREFCYMGNSKAFIIEMDEAGTPRIKVDCRKQIGHNPMGKSIKELANQTGVPMPTKRQMGAHFLRCRALTGLKEHGVCDFKTRLTFCHESDEAHLMYPESELKMHDQKYAAQMLNGMTVLVTMVALNIPEEDSDDDEIVFKVQNAPTQIVAIPGSMLTQLLATSSGKEKSEKLVAKSSQ
jgi:hypothetical protein